MVETDKCGGVFVGGLSIDLTSYTTHTVHE